MMRPCLYPLGQFKFEFWDGARIQNKYRKHRFIFLCNCTPAHNLDNILPGMCTMNPNVFQLDPTKI